MPALITGSIVGFSGKFQLAQTTHRSTDEQYTTMKIETAESFIANNWMTVSVTTESGTEGIGE